MEIRQQPQLPEVFQPIVCIGGGGTVRSLSAEQEGAPISDGTLDQDLAEEPFETRLTPLAERKVP